MSIEDIVLSRIGYRAASPEIKARFGGTVALIPHEAQSAVDIACIDERPVVSLVHPELLREVPIESVRRTPSKSRESAIYADYNEYLGVFTHPVVFKPSERHTDVNNKVLIGYGSEMECYWLSKVLSATSGHLYDVARCMFLIHGEKPMMQWSGVLWSLMEMVNLTGLRDDDATTLQFISPVIRVDVSGEALTWMTSSEASQWRSYARRVTNRYRYNSDLTQYGRDICAPFAERDYTGRTLTMVIDVLETVKRRRAEMQRELAAA